MRPLATLTAATATLGLAAIAAEGLLRTIAPAQRPLSAPVRVRVEIGAPIEQAWEVVADIPGQVRWMPEMKRVAVIPPGPVAVGPVGEATVGFLGISVSDRVTITTFEPPVAFAIEHHGLFGGSGRLDLLAGLDGETTIVEWVEQLVPPVLPAVGWLLGRHLTAWLYQRDLFLLRDIVEETSHPATG